MGAQLSWQVVPLSTETIDRYNLWDSDNFKIAGADVLKNVVKGSTPEALLTLSHDLSWWLNPGLVSAVNTYAWRSSDAMLATAQDWRAGQRTESAHPWQATLDNDAVVFTTHPKSESDEGDKPGSQGGYWSGDGASPSSRLIAP